VQPEIELGPLTLQTFGICFAAAFLAAGALIGVRFRELGKPVDWAYEMGFAALAGGIIGARADWLIQNWDEASDDLLGNIFSGSGLVWFGGLIGGALAVGRIGCQLSGDGDYGREWDGPWAMSYPDGTVPTTDEVHPTPIYETLAMGGVAFALWRLRNRLTGGLLFALYLLLAGLERFLVEFIRRNDDVALGLTQAQLISVGMILVGGIWLAYAYTRTSSASRPGVRG
jgi:phosphatidylglycerol:prolipoprotein diacylglycerol transferase